MSETASSMLALGTLAPDFNLPDPFSGDSVKLSDYAGKPILVIFSCNHCPYVLHILESLVDFAAEISTRDITTVMINANDIDKYPADSPEKMTILASQYGFEFPYLYDQSQSVAIAYKAACTPDFFLFDETHKLFYRGQYDASRPGNSKPVNGADLKAATLALIQKENSPDNQIPSMGCNIKWRANNQPDYF